MEEMSAPLAAQVESLKAYVRLIAGANPTSHLYEVDGIMAAVCPSAPAQPMANVATCSDPDWLLVGLEDLAHAYEAAGVSAWQLWDATGADPHLLEADGYKYVGHRPGMSADLETFAPEVRLGGFVWDRHDDLEVVGRVNEARYPNGAGLTAALSRAPSHLEMFVYEAVVGRRTGAVVCMVYPLGDDVTGFFLATDPTNPEARGKGLGRKLYVAALRDAHHNGYKTASLQASAKGQPIADDLGFRPVGPRLFAVYERFRSASA